MRICSWMSPRPKYWESSGPSGPQKLVPVATPRINSMYLSQRQHLLVLHHCMALHVYPIDRLLTCLSRLPDVIVHIVPFCSDLKARYL